MSYQKVIIVGSLGRDPEMRYTGDGTPVTSLSVATNRRWTNSDGSQGEETVWFRVSAWRRLAETCAQHLSKDWQVMVEGRITPDRETGGPRVWVGQDGTPKAAYELTADRVVMLSDLASTDRDEQGEEDQALADDRFTRRTRYGEPMDADGNVWTIELGMLDPDGYAAYIRECAAREPWDFPDLWDD
jgi:single-strand DNA-binding protein